MSEIQALDQNQFYNTTTKLDDHNRIQHNPKRKRSS